ncbi:MAG: Ycf66 family protein [Thermosynechococcaceae cyanobacterium]
MGFGTPVPLLIGIVLILLGVGLFFLDTFKPGYKRDSDTVYAVLFLAVGILSLLIWNAGFAEALQLMVSAGTLIALMIERIQNRSASSTQARQTGNSMPFREDDRPSRGYRPSVEEDRRSGVRAELDDDFMPLTQESARLRRIRGTRADGRDAYDQNSYEDPFPDDSRSSQRSSRRSSRSYLDNEPTLEEDRPRRRRPLQLEGDQVNGSNPYPDEFSPPVEPTIRRHRGNSRSTGATASTEELPSSARSRRRSRSQGDRPPVEDEYVDYKPLEPPQYPSSDDEFDNSNNFDDEPPFK